LSPTEKFSSVILGTGREELDFQQGVGIFLFATDYRPAVELTPASYAVGTGGSFRGGKVAGA